MKVSVRALGPLEANCYIVDGRLMIDPGDDVSGLEDFIRAEGAEIGEVAITHRHYDHMLGAAHMQKRGAKLLISRLDAPALENADEAIVPWDYMDHFAPCRADGFLEEGPGTLAGIPFEILAAPGHSAGGVCLYSAQAKVLFTGDTLFRYGFGRTDLIGGNMRALVDSIKRLFTLPPDVYVWPGHGEGGLLGDIMRSYHR